MDTFSIFFEQANKYKIGFIKYNSQFTPGLPTFTPDYNTDYGTIIASSPTEALHKLKHHNIKIKLEKEVFACGEETVIDRFGREIELYRFIAFPFYVKNDKLILKLLREISFMSEQEIEEIEIELRGEIF